LAEIRILTEKDLDRAKSLMRALCNEVNVPFDEERWEKSIQRRLTDDEVWGIHFLLLAEEDGQPCGIAFAEVLEDIPGGIDYYGYISNIYVSPELRGRGIGKQLLLESIKSLKRSNISKIRLNIRTKMEKLTKLVETLGFKEVFKIMEKND